MLCSIVISLFLEEQFKSPHQGLCKWCSQHFLHKAQKTAGRFHALVVKVVLSSKNHVAQSSTAC